MLHHKHLGKSFPSEFKRLLKKIIPKSKGNLGECAYIAIDCSIWISGQYKVNSRWQVRVPPFPLCKYVFRLEYKKFFCACRSILYINKKNSCPLFFNFLFFFLFRTIRKHSFALFYTALAWFLCVSKSVIITIGVDFDTFIFSLSLCCIQSIYTYIQPLLYIQHIHTPFFILSLSLSLCFSYIYFYYKKKH